jgi:hypothetical protein
MYRATAHARVSVGQDTDSRGAATERRAAAEGRAVRRGGGLVVRRGGWCDAAAGAWCRKAAGVPPRPRAVPEGACCWRRRRPSWTPAKFLLMK